MNGLVAVVSSSKSGSAGEEGAVDGVDNGLSADLAATEETPVETFDGILAAGDAVKFEVDVASGVRI